MAKQEPLQSLTQIPHQGEPIDDLNGLRRPLPNPCGIQPTTITADDLDAGGRLQPLRDRGGRALGQQIHRLMALEITHNSPEPSAPPPGPFVEPTAPWGLQGWKRRFMDQTHNRPETPWYAPGSRKPHTRVAAHRYAHLTEGRLYAQTMAATDRDEGWKPLGKNPRPQAVYRQKTRQTCRGKTSVAPARGKSATVRW